MDRRWSRRLLAGMFWLRDNGEAGEIVYLRSSSCIDGLNKKLLCCFFKVNAELVPNIET